MQTPRHDLFQQMAQALSHQQHGHPVLALAYWKNVLQSLPEEIRVHNEILEECRRIVSEAETDSQLQHNLSDELDTLRQRFHQQIAEEEEEVTRGVYQAMCQQSQGQYLLAFAYWKNVLPQISSDSLVITLAVQDVCWKAHHSLSTGKLKPCLKLYTQLLRTFPDFLEGYLNLSLILLNKGFMQEIPPLFDMIPAAYRQEFIVTRYAEFYRKIAEILQHFEHVPYAIIEEIANDLRIENTYYPSINTDYFATCITDLVEREHRFFERQRKSREEKAISLTNKRLARQGIALGQRVTMAKQAGSEDVSQFLHDNDIRIMEVLVNNPNIMADDMLIVAQTSPVADILRLLACHQKWGTLQTIRLAILLNPQTLPQDSIPLLPLLSMHDLAKIFYKKTLPTEVRIRAKQRIQEIFERLRFHDKVAAIEASSGNLLKLLDFVAFDVSSFLIHLLGQYYDAPDILINICRWKLTPPSILAVIANNPELTLNFQVTFALLSNPKTPVRIVNALLLTIPEKDVVYLLRNTYLPPSVKDSISTLFPHLLTA